MTGGARTGESGATALMRPVALALCAALISVGARSQAPARVNFEGKTINLVSGGSGGYESYARLLAAHMGKFIPGNPSIVVRSMPGAASMAAANYLYNIAAPDGLTLGSFVRAIPLAPLLGDTAAKYDGAKFSWIGSASSYRDDAYMLMVRKDVPVSNVADLAARETPLRLGSTGPSSEGDVGARVVGQTLGLKLKMVRGYSGTPQIAIAVEQGEMDGMMIGASSLSAFRPEWLSKTGPVRFLFQFGYGGEGRSPQFPDVPRVDELARDADERALFSLMQLPFRIARPFAAPPGLPEETRAMLEAAFLRALDDPALLTGARGMGLDVSPVSGAEISALIAAAARLPAPLITRYTQLLWSAD